MKQAIFSYSSDFIFNSILIFLWHIGVGICLALGASCFLFSSIYILFMY